VYFLRPYLDPIARRAASRQLCAHRVSPFTFRVADARLAVWPTLEWSDAGVSLHYVPASVTSAISFGSSLPPIGLTRRDTGRRNEIMSAVRGLRSSERDHGAPGRSLMTQIRHGAVSADQGSEHLNRLDRLETRGGPILCWLFEAFSFQ
jgi:hypothetical protein